MGASIAKRRGKNEETFEKGIKMCTLAIIDQAIDAANSIKKNIQEISEAQGNITTAFQAAQATQGG